MIHGWVSMVALTRRGIALFRCVFAGSTMKERKKTASSRIRERRRKGRGRGRRGVKDTGTAVCIVLSYGNSMQRTERGIGGDNERENRRRMGREEGRERQRERERER